MAFDAKAASATLRDLHGAFEKALIPDLPIPQFADMFAQTLAYGLFAARCDHHGPKGSFKRLGAASETPKTNPFLRQLFETITGTALDEEPFAEFVDDLAQLLADTDIAAVLADFGKRTAATTRWYIFTKPSWRPMTPSCANRGSLSPRSRGFLPCAVRGSSLEDSLRVRERACRHGHGGI